MPDRLDEIRARAEAATPGPWYPWDRGVGWHIAVTENREQPWGIPKLLPEGHDTDLGRREDAEFIAHARDDVPWLLNKLAEAERLHRNACKLIDRYHGLSERINAAQDQHLRTILTALGLPIPEFGDRDFLFRHACNEITRLRELLAEHGIEVPS